MTLLERKQKLVRDAIWDAAIDLFAARSFEAVTVDEIAASAGVSRRTFFRYFASKDDLLGQGIATFGLMIQESIEACPPGLAPLALARHAVTLLARRLTAQPRTRQAMQIVERSTLARAAHLSRMAAVESQTLACYQARLAALPPLRLQLLTSLTFATLDLALRAWYHQGAQDVGPVLDAAFAELQVLLAPPPPKRRRAGA